MEQKKKIRLSDIAEKLNVSTVTVSKALSNKDGVGDDLRKQIKDLAEELGYKYKKSSSTVNAGTTGNIGILIPSRFFSMDSSYYWYLFNHLSTELLKHGFYSIIELITDENEANLDIPKMLLDNKVDGIIILGQIGNKYINSIHSRYNNFILLDFYTEDPNLDSVSNDDYYCSYILTKYVISQGHKKLRFVGTFDATTSIRDRYMGFQKAMHENKLDTSFSEIIDDRDEKGQQIQMNIPQTKAELPDAFICNNDVTASNLMNILESKGFKIPEDVSVTGFDNYLGKNSVSTPLTTVYIKPEDIAKVASDVIIKKINGEPYLKGRHLVGGSIIIRDSVKKQEDL